MSNVNMQRKLTAAGNAPARLSLGEHLMLYSQYILVALLVLGALVLRMVFGAP